MEFTCDTVLRLKYMLKSNQNILSNFLLFWILQLWGVYNSLLHVIWVKKSLLALQLVRLKEKFLICKPQNFKNFDCFEAVLNINISGWNFYQKLSIATITQWKVGEKLSDTFVFWDHTNGYSGSSLSPIYWARFSCRPFCAHNNFAESCLFSGWHLALWWAIFDTAIIP